MLQSMTGFGREVIFLAKKKITIEIKSLNSKQCDINFRIPSIYREKEIEMRGLVATKLKRGKIDVSIQVEHLTPPDNFNINTTQVKNYYRELKKFAEESEIFDQSDFISTIMRMPEVLIQESENISKEEWAAIFDGIKKAIELLIEFRTEEGEILLKTFKSNISTIIKQLNSVKEKASDRIPALKQRLHNSFQELENSIKVDENRFAQEVIFYIEKLDITEEEIRLQKHCDFFIKELASSESKGKKLGFISQEIGREINTIGSKANNADIQHMVVEMKDELEKIKEQMLNIL